MQQLGRPDAVDDPQAGAFVPGPPGGGGQVLPGRDAAAQRRQVVHAHVVRAEGVQHRPVGGRRGEQHRHPVLGQRGQQPARHRVLQQQRARAGAQREDDEPAEAEGEAEGRTAREHVVGAGPQHVPGEGVGDGEQVAVEVHAALGPPGGPRGEGDQGDVVCGGRDGGERRVVAIGQSQQVVRGAAPVGGDPQPRHLGLHQVVQHVRMAQGVPDLGHRAHRRQLLRALLGQHGDGDRARLHDREPARGEPGAGGPAQEHPVAGYDAEVGGEDVGEAVHAVAQPAVRPHLAGAVAEGRAVGATVPEPGDGGVEQLGTAVQPVRIGQFGQIEEELRPGVRGWQVVAGEGVGVSGRLEVQGGFAPLAAVRSGVGPAVRSFLPATAGRYTLERIVMVTAVNRTR